MKTALFSFVALVILGASPFDAAQAHRGNQPEHAGVVQ
jgi:hypothetical protein